MTSHLSWQEKHKHAWTRGLDCLYNEVIKEVEEEMSIRDDAHHQELSRKAEEKQMLSAHINQLVIKNGGLVLENNDLKHQIKRLESRLSDDEQRPHCPSFSQSGVANDPATERIAETAPIPAREYRHLVEKFNALNEIHQEVVQKAKYLEKKNATVMQKNREMKDNVKAWQEYSDRQRKKQAQKIESVRAAESSKLAATGRSDRSPYLSSPRAGAVRTPLSPMRMGTSSPVSLLPLTDNNMASVVGRDDAANHVVHHEQFERHTDLLRGQERDVTFEPQTSERTKSLEKSRSDQAPTYSDHKNFPTEMVDSSQTTEDEIVLQLTPTASTSVINMLDEDPQVVSSKTLKRKRTKHPSLSMHPAQVPSDGTPSNPFHVKEERFSSPPALPEVQQHLRTETLDLDEVRLNFGADAQRRQRYRPLAHSSNIASLQSQRSVSVPLIKEEHDDGRGNLYADVSSPSIGRAEADQMEASTETRAFSEPFNHASGLRGPLERISHNIHTPQSLGEEPLLKRLRRDQIQEQVKFHILTESDDTMPPMNKQSRRLDPDIARQNFNSRVNATRRTPASAKRTHGPVSSVVAATGSLAASPSTDARTNDTPLSRPGLRTAQHTATGPKPKAVIDSDTAPSPRRQAGNIRLRTRAPTELKISDFKVNPTYNGGYSFAFTETVRKRADRACLPGCTRPECCGSTFRTLALTAAPLSLSQEELLLEEYLGEAYDTMRLTQMSSHERSELVLQARTRDFAKKHGRHRQAYERHTTPPGFWRVDFPTTQEADEDRKKAEQMERKMVEERWIEAMRKNGKWMFRDE